MVDIADNDIIVSHYRVAVIWLDDPVELYVRELKIICLESRSISEQHPPTLVDLPTALRILCAGWYRRRHMKYDS